MDPKIQETLTKSWLPRLNGLKDSRRPLRIVMMCCIIVPLILVFVILILLVILYITDPESKKPVWEATGLMSAFLTLAGVCFAYLGKIQACEDSVLEIELYVHMGNQEKLFDSLKNLTCYSGFHSIIDDMAKIFPKS